MILVRLGFAVVLVVIANIVGARASDREVTVADMMIDLQRLQVKMAQGDKSAYSKSQDKLKAIGLAIAAASEDSLKVVGFRIARTI